MTDPIANQSGNPFKENLRKDRRQIGLWCGLSSNLVAELFNPIGFDWILFDGEHAPNDIPILLGQLQAMRGSATEPIVRPEWNDAVIIKRLLDIGFRSFLVPMVQNSEEARAAVAATGGHATLIRAPADVRATVAVFEPQPGALGELSARVKSAFDPNAILNPGRMVEGV